ncbi:hypothetical protein [Nostoc sp. LPT]|uniref:hypothetical protein n=1 Tax=Nostoc sp. LPT TaxID=2815387 RepID=UPI0025FDD7E7|nr:hypothetical protein [Nostoc sp. LPT]
MRYIADPVSTYNWAFSDGSFLPRSLYIGYPEFNYVDLTTQRLGYTLTHKFNDNWQIRNNLSVLWTETFETYTFPVNLVDDRFMEMDGSEREFT